MSKNKRPGSWALTELKEHLHADLDGSPIKPVFVAAELGLSYQMLLNSCNPNLDDFRMSLRDFEGFCRVTGGRKTLAHVCSRLGGVFIDLPEAPQGSADVLIELANVTREYGHLLEAIADATRPDGEKGRKISAHEAKRIEIETVELQGRLTALLRRVQEVAL